ncbi:cytoglobin-2-like [Protopterus annectens]|uniref:cytoglobin-2-like n=1 Tax=Protopterus annectens TaxID=7888 RepID=UPI001CF9CC3F|nr:cytoglobin-2-like [Protopterus annectens]
MCSLSTTDIKNIRDIWSIVCQNPEENGRTVVIRLFLDYPQTRTYFKNFKNIDTEEGIKESRQVRQHGRRVVMLLSKVIECLEDWDKTSTLLSELADRHQQHHKVEVVNFKFLFAALNSVYIDVFGPTFTPDIEASWQKFYSLTYQQLEKCYSTCPSS